METVEGEYRVRITSQGKIRAWVTFALEFFDVCERDLLVEDDL
jgi:hypothetical protein